MTISDDRVQEAFRHAKLLWLVSCTHKVTFRAGKGWITECPKCKKDTLCVAIDDKSYQCFNPDCGTGGNAVNWVSSIYGIGFPHALIVIEQLNTADNRTPEFEIEYPPKEEESNGQEKTRLHVIPTPTNG